MNDPLFFVFAETLVRMFKIAGLTFLAYVAVAVLLLAIFGKSEGDSQP